MVNDETLELQGLPSPLVWDTEIGWRVYSAQMNLATKDEIMRSAIMSLFLSCTCAWILAQTAIAPAGEGSFNNPYQISSLQNLYWIAASDDIVPSPSQQSLWSSNYIQLADIDATSTATPGLMDRAGVRLEDTSIEVIRITCLLRGVQRRGSCDQTNPYLPPLYTLVVGFFWIHWGRMITKPWLKQCGSEGWMGSRQPGGVSKI
jgi:hypothetical protein